ncbi:hypothetical protein [Andreprevotia chitinilytica]|uniref:hypothetical protein n=1 Tax=Andreprevotia chitinilytica TaxID=396808 RepID=UPI000552E2FF|nr:hypothetical protein [Andreprevotia chitinilytica]
MAERAYKDPVFDEVARREEAERRRAERMAKQAANDAERRSSPDYRLRRRRRILGLVAIAKRGSDDRSGR